MDFMQDIEQFHKKFGIEYGGYPDRPRILPADLDAFRQRFLDEELSEYKEALQRARLAAALSSPDAVTHHLARAFDGLIDLVYVAIGTAYLHGFDFNEGWRRVHEANMKKVRTPSAGASARGSIHDVIKPPGWQAPSLIDLVTHHVHK